ncbi:hypothetical protein HPB48_013409 [Haemaphysalis longicornis]|uniref:PEP-utilising enzyme mobile domain-containing protein n=1 Tax=Haemaphysalis longicornis TaxID=44386 RepID=A0A9J6GHP7_HAELO|nr:hypothetical protein HPB48_013409 [Haemaphysalis longicornis]
MCASLFLQSAVVRIIHQLRLVCHQLSLQMVREGRIPSPELLFFFTYEELGLLLRTRAPELVLNEYMFPRAQKGEILVTTATDTGWTPYFPLLAGVVTEIGGPLSHAHFELIQTRLKELVIDEMLNK